MRCALYLDFFFPEQFKTKPRSRLSKTRDKELETIKKRGQQRRIVVSIYGEVVPSDIPLYEALLVADYSAIAVVVVVGSPESVDIKAAKALSAKYPLPWVGIGRMPPGAESPSPFGNLRNTTSRIEPQLVRFRRRPINCLSQNE